MRVWRLAVPIAGALSAAAALAPGFAAGSAPASATFTAYDYGWSANGSANSTRLTIARGGTVSFSYPSGRSEHNANFGTGPKPSSCIQAAGAVSGRTPPLPNQPTGAGWSGTCSFETPGIYQFHCALHPFMTGTVVVEGPGGSPFAGRPAVSSPQRGTAVRGSVRLSAAATGGRLEVDLRAKAKSLGRQGNHLIGVGRLIRLNLRPGALRFAAALDAAARRAERTAGRLTVIVEVAVQPPGRSPVSFTRRLLVEP